MIQTKQDQSKHRTDNAFCRRRRTILCLFYFIQKIFTRPFQGCGSPNFVQIIVNCRLAGTIGTHRNC